MEFPTLYLAEIVSLVLLLILLLIGTAVASRYFPNRPVIKTVRNLVVALAVATFAASMTYSLIVNETPRGKVDRSAVDQDQKDFEQRHSGQAK